MHRLIPGALALAGAFLIRAPLAAQQVPDSLPAGVTAKMITDGASLFKGQGICVACHGAEGKGIPNLGADLTDKEWTHSDGSFSGILETVSNGVPPEQSTSGAAMPPKGGSALTNAQLEAVAAYVWSLSRRQ